jgi:glycosyltransferase involved in cell wall biosynthesis
MPTSELEVHDALGESGNGSSGLPSHPIHAVWYGGRGGSGGLIRYLKGVLAIPAESSGVRITLVCSPALAGELGELNAAVRVIAVPSLEKAVSAQLWEQMHLGRFMRRLRPDVLFCVSGSPRALPAGVPVVAACHNILYFDQKEYRKYRYSRLWFRFMRRLNRKLRALYPKTAGVIFTSRYSQELAIRQLAGIRRHTVIANGVEAAFLADSPVPTIDQAPRNILYVSTVYLYKYQGNVVKAVKQLRESTGRDYQLWLAGNAGEDPLGRRELLRVIEQEGANAFTCLLGNISHDALPALLRKADLFVFASSCEAFGITLLEAMASGLPVACSNRSGLPDLLRDAGEYFNPEHATEIASALARLCGDSAIRREYAERAMRYAREYTWSGCAEETFAFLRDVTVSAQDHRHA